MVIFTELVCKVLRRFNIELVPYGAFYPGHFYSPIPSEEDVKIGIKRLKMPGHKNYPGLSPNPSEEDVEIGIGRLKMPRELPGINLNEKNQFDNLVRLSKYYNDLPFPDNKTDELRYCYNNGSYSYTDAIFLYSMIRDIKPKRIIEIGCGQTTALITDVNETYFNYGINHTCIEPYPTYLYECIRSEDVERITVIEKKLQDVDIELFESLSQDDLLFIDSSHVVKFDSDVFHIFYNILPSLKKGVFIHFHDIFYPFEMPQKWIEDGRYWNENYFLRNFLAYNNEFEIYLFATFLHNFYEDWFSENMPLTLKDWGGNIYLRRI